MRKGDFLLKDSTFHYAVIGANISGPLNITTERSIEPLRITVPRKGVKTALMPEDEFNTLPVVPAGIFSTPAGYEKMTPKQLREMPVEN